MTNIVELVVQIEKRYYQRLYGRSKLIEIKHVLSDDYLLV